MKKSILPIMASIFFLTMFLSGCGNGEMLEPIATATDSAMPTITTTVTPDLCAPESIQAEVDKVHRHMREFDDAASLVLYIPSSQLSGPIAGLQKIRREAEDEVIPACLGNLRGYQIQHMNSVISTLISFMGASDPAGVDCTSVERSAEAEVICQSFAIARQQHDQYILELARLLGLTPVAGTAVAIPSATPTP